ncbi:MAG: flagellar basal-body rod protein FlgF [Oscillospiraceae bacterium]|jgi:flagellar basal-body rod protein FlgG|nr:flagellar basal-body rod protein FlgF [Oscillospiraceae bacterium]
MTRGVYISGAGMLLQRRAMEVVTNNITNADTTGYKKEYLTAHTFDAELLRRVNDNAETESVARSGGMPPRVGDLNFGSQIDRLYYDFASGGFEETGRGTDLAVQGEGFFVLDTPAGERYTRSGAFLVDRDGYLIDAGGSYVLGRDGRIYTGGNEFSVGQDGTVTLANGAVAGTLRLAEFADRQTLRKQGGNLFEALAPPDDGAGRSVIRAGYLENSNVDISREMAELITVYRVYETNQKMLTMNDEINGKAASLGALR